MLMGNVIYQAANISFNDIKYTYGTIVKAADAQLLVKKICPVARFVNNC